MLQEQADLWHKTPKFQFWVSSDTDPARNYGEGKRVKTLLCNKTWFWKMTVILQATAIFPHFNL